MPLNVRVHPFSQWLKHPESQWAKRSRDWKLLMLKHLKRWLPFFEIFYSTFSGWKDMINLVINIYNIFFQSKIHRKTRWATNTWFAHPFKYPHHQEASDKRTPSNNFFSCPDFFGHLSFPDMKSCIKFEIQSKFFSQSINIQCWQISHSGL